LNHSCEEHANFKLFEDSSFFDPVQCTERLGRAGQEALIVYTPQEDLPGRTRGGGRGRGEANLRSDQGGGGQASVCTKTPACEMQGVLEASGTSTEFVLELWDAVYATGAISRTAFGWRRHLPENE